MVAAVMTAAGAVAVDRAVAVSDARAIAEVDARAVAIADARAVAIGISVQRQRLYRFRNKSWPAHATMTNRM